MIPYTITNKNTGEILTATDWTSSTGEGQDFLEFKVGEQSIKFNRPEHMIDSEHFDNGEYTATYVNEVPMVEAPVENA